MRPRHEFKGSGGAGNAQIWLACFHLADDDQTKILELVMPRTRTLWVSSVKVKVVSTNFPFGSVLLGVLFKRPRNKVSTYFFSWVQHDFMCMFNAKCAHLAGSRSYIQMWANSKHMHNIMMQYDAYIYIYNCMYIYIYINYEYELFCQIGWLLATCYSIIIIIIIIIINVFDMLQGFATCTFIGSLSCWHLVK